MHLSFYEWKGGSYWTVNLEWPSFPFVYMRSFLVPRPAAVAIWSNIWCHSWQIPPICVKIPFNLDRIEYFKQNHQVLWRCLFIWLCERLSIHKALYIDVWDMAISHRNGRQRSRAAVSKCEVHMCVTSAWGHDKPYFILPKEVTNYPKRLEIETDYCDNRGMWAWCDTVWNQWFLWWCRAYFNPGTRLILNWWAPASHQGCFHSIFLFI